MSEELKPCPFCGGEVHVYETCEYMSDVCDYFINCDNCNGSWFIGTGWTDFTESTLIATWNRRASGWISVEDKLPMPYDVVLISIATKNGYDKPIAIVTLGCYEDDRWIQVGYDRGYELSEGERVTHWMPLPEPPKEGE